MGWAVEMCSSTCGNRTIAWYPRHEELLASRVWRISLSQPSLARHPLLLYPARSQQPGAPARLSTFSVGSVPVPGPCRLHTPQAPAQRFVVHNRVAVPCHPRPHSRPRPAAPLRPPPRRPPAPGAVDGSLMFWLAGRPDAQGEGCIPAAHEAAVWSTAWHPLGHVLASGGCSTS